MAIAVDPKKVFDYVLLCDREQPKEQQTIFHLKVLTARELADIEDKAARADMQGNLEFRSGTQIIRILNAGMKGWSNFKNAAGEEVAFRENNGAPRQENWDVLRPEWRRELANAITEQNALTEADQKN